MKSVPEESRPSVCGDGTPVSNRFVNPDDPPPMLARSPVGGPDKFYGRGTKVDVYTELSKGVDSSSDDTEGTVDVAQQPAHTGKSAFLSGSMLDYLRDQAYGGSSDDPTVDEMA